MELIEFDTRGWGARQRPRMQFSAPEKKSQPSTPRHGHRVRPCVELCFNAASTLLSSPRGKRMRTMHMVIVVSIIVVAIALIGILGMALRAGDKAPAIGSAAPDFTLNSQDGKPVSLHDYKGKWVVLYFYPKDMTSGCTIEAHNFQRDLAKFDAKNAAILGVSMQDQKSHQ